MSVRIDKQLRKIADRDVDDGLRRADKNDVRLAAELMPTGAVITWWKALAIPAGWMELIDGGRVVKRSDYPALSVVLGKEFNRTVSGDNDLQLPDPNDPLLMNDLPPGPKGQVWIMKV